MSTSQPLSPLRSQSWNPVSQLVTPHVPAVHVPMALVNWQKCEHLPQLVMLSASGSSQPLLPMRSQLP